MADLLITCHHLLRHIDNFKSKLIDLNINYTTPEILSQQLKEREMLNLLPGHKIVIAGDDEITKGVIQKSLDHGLQNIIKWGIGTDSIDKKFAKLKKIGVYNTPNVFGDEVADIALSYILNLARGTHLIHNSVLDNQWLKIEGITLKYKTVGIIGLGSIGKSIAKRCKAFGMKIYGYDPFIENKLSDYEIKNMDIEQLARNSDFIVLSCNLTNKNKHMVNEKFFRLMKKDSYIINVARGPLINEIDLIKALSSKRIAGCALDVFEIEPLPKSSSLRRFNNCIFGSHNSSNTFDAVTKVNKLTIDIACKLLGRENNINLENHKIV